MEASVPAWDLLVRLGDEEVVVVDCRSAEERRRWPVQIPGTVHMTLAEIAEAPWVLPDDELIVLCDATGDGNAVRRARQVLTRAGRTAVVLEGGLHAWLAAGFPTEQLALALSRLRDSGLAEASAPGHG